MNRQTGDVSSSEKSKEAHVKDAVGSDRPFFVCFVLLDGRITELYRFVAEILSEGGRILHNASRFWLLYH